MNISNKNHVMSIRFRYRKAFVPIIVWWAVAGVIFIIGLATSSGVYRTTSEFANVLEKSSYIAYVIVFLIAIVLCFKIYIKNKGKK